MASYHSIKLSIFFIFICVLQMKDVFPYKVEGDQDAVAYLTYYGYVDPDTMPLGFTLRDCNKKLKEFQKLAKVQVTGVLDADTIKAMNTPRCGCPDFVHLSFKQSSTEESGERKYGTDKHRHQRHHNHGYSDGHHHHHFHRHHQNHNHSDDSGSQRRRHFNPELFAGRNMSLEVARYTATDLKWKKEIVTYNIVQFPRRYGMRVSSGDIENAIHKAFKIWEKHINLEFRFEPNNVDVDIEISFVSAYHGDNYPFDGPGNTLAHAFFPGTGLGGDVHFEEDEDWSLGVYNGIDVLYVAVHEIGHSLGLGHSSDYGSIMYPMYRGHIPNLELHSDDILGVQSLYGPRFHHEATSRPRPPPTTPTQRTRPTSSTKSPITTKSPWTNRTTTTSSPCSKGDLCEDCEDRNEIDGITTMLGDAIIVFKGNYAFEIGKNGEGTLPGWPRFISEYFPRLEGNLDAVMTRSNGKTYFFKGSKYWRFRGRRMDKGYPRSITEYFPGIPTNIDAAFEWDEEFVFTKGNKFWRFNTRRRPQVQSFFPMPLSHWGVTHKLDAAFKAPNGTIYFFEGQHYWEFDQTSHKVKNEASVVSGKWFGCWEP